MPCRSTLLSPYLLAAAVAVACMPSGERAPVADTEAATDQNADSASETGEVESAEEPVRELVLAAADLDHYERGQVVWIEQLERWHEKVKNAKTAATQLAAMTTYPEVADIEKKAGIPPGRLDALDGVFGNVLIAAMYAPAAREAAASVAKLQGDLQKADTTKMTPEERDMIRQMLVGAQSVDSIYASSADSSIYDAIPPHLRAEFKTRERRFLELYNRRLKAALVGKGTQP